MLAKGATEGLSPRGTLAISIHNVVDKVVKVDFRASLDVNDFMPLLYDQMTSFSFKPLGDLDVISKMQFPTLFYWLVW